MKINSENNNSAVLSELGARIKRNRIDMQLSQQDFAAKAGISTRTLSAAENGEDIRLSNLIRILRTLGCLENIDLLLPELAFDPEAYRTLGRERKRISKSNKNRNKIKWKWEDEK
jgi:transcriptional regulator with XRE-family HTH domain